MASRDRWQVSSQTDAVRRVHRCRYYSNSKAVKSRDGLLRRRLFMEKPAEASKGLYLPLGFPLGREGRKEKGVGWPVVVVEAWECDGITCYHSMERDQVPCAWE